MGIHTATPPIRKVFFSENCTGKAEQFKVVTVRDNVELPVEAMGFA